MEQAVSLLVNVELPEGGESISKLFKLIFNLDVAHSPPQIDGRTCVTRSTLIQ